MDFRCVGRFALDLEGVEEVVVNEEAVTSDAQPLLIYTERNKEESATAG